MLSNFVYTEGQQDLELHIASHSQVKCQKEEKFSLSGWMLENTAWETLRAILFGDWSRPPAWNALLSGAETKSKDWSTILLLPLRLSVGQFSHISSQRIAPTENRRPVSLNALSSIPVKRKRQATIAFYVHLYWKNYSGLELVINSDEYCWPDSDQLYGQLPGDGSLHKGAAHNKW